MRSKIVSLLVSLLLVVAVLPAQQKPESPLPFTTGELQDIYDTYNREYWDGKLPKATVVWTAHDHKYGETRQDPDGRFRVRLDVIKNRESNVAKTTILHEMCHVKTWGEKCHMAGVDGSCRRFYIELHRIMLEGAFDDIL